MLNVLAVTRSCASLPARAQNRRVRPCGRIGLAAPARVLRDLVAGCRLGTACRKSPTLQVGPAGDGPCGLAVRFSMGPVGSIRLDRAPSRPCIAGPAGCSSRRTHLRVPWQALRGASREVLVPFSVHQPRRVFVASGHATDRTSAAAAFVGRPWPRECAPRCLSRSVRPCGFALVARDETRDRIVCARVSVYRGRSRHGSCVVSSSSEAAFRYPLPKLRGPAGTLRCVPAALMGFVPSQCCSCPRGFGGVVRPVVSHLPFHVRVRPDNFRRGIGRASPHRSRSCHPRWFGRQPIAGRIRRGSWAFWFFLASNPCRRDACPLARALGVCRRP